MAVVSVTVEAVSSQVQLYTRRVSSWSAAQEELGYFDETWVFRGQRDASWALQCNLARKRGTSDPVDMELSVTGTFKQRAHLFLPTSREPETTLEWLSLLQHHGGPTRLIDFTRSSLVAAFFSLEDDVDADASAVWALNGHVCHRRAVKRLRSIDPEYSWLQEHHDIERAVNDRLGARPAQRFVAPVQLSRMNARMAIQQGLFVCLGDPGSDLFENLSPEVEDEEPVQVVKIEFPRTERGEALWSLRRVNISRETLFPGLDGLAQSLAHSFLPRNIDREILLHLMGRPAGWPGPTPT